jgi:hypothetical protein
MKLYPRDALETMMMMMMIPCDDTMIYSSAAGYIRSQSANLS